VQKLYILSTVALLSLACKQSSETSEETPVSSPSTPEAISQAYGIQAWDNVNEIQFTFNVDRDDFHSERSFHWKPKSDDIIYINGSDTLSYNRQQTLDSLQMEGDKRFINDKYWLMVPFQLIWDPNLEFTDTKNVVAPISNDTLNKLTFVYPSEGGYTPGDAYDLYYNNEFLVKEWSFRQANQSEPNLTMTWENVVEMNGLKFATMHQDSLGHLKIHFTNLHID